MTKKSWFNGHAHSYYSFLDGYSRPKSYAERAVELDMPAAVITDHGNIHGWLNHEDACKEAGIKAIYGIEAYQARKSRFDTDPEERSGPATMEWEQRGPYHLTIMAKDNAGYNNIIKLSSLAYLDGYFVKPRMDKELVNTYSDGLIVLSGCLGGEVQQALLRGDFEAALKSAASWQDIVGKENYFIEIHDHGIEEQLNVKPDLIRIAKMIGAKIAPSADCHYVNKEDSMNHDALLCVQTGAVRSDEKRFKFANDEFYLKSREEMEKHFEPEWLDNTLEIADMCNVEIKRGEYYFPQFQVPDSRSKEEFFDDTVWGGIKKRYSVVSDEIIERTKQEISVIKNQGFMEYFLIVYDIVNWAKSNSIRVGKARGSVAGSVVSYAMGITDIDPMKYALMFERFLIEGRLTMPDIDLDFDDRYRDKVIDYVKEKYGSDHISNIVTFSSIKAKSAIQDAGRVLGFPFPTVNKISQFVPPPINGVSKTLAECMEDPDFINLYETDPEAKQIIDVARGFEGVPRQTGVHASGVLITNKPVMEYVPVMRKTNKDGTPGPIVTQWVGEEMDRLGLLKIDFLGNRNLSIIDICLKNIKEYRGLDVDIDSIPLDDKLTFDLYKNGHTVSCFQVSGEGMRTLMVDMKPDNMFDVMALISLFRPGPMGSGMHRMYINRKHGNEVIDYVHPLLKEDLKDSYGVFVYQEHLLAAARILAGFTPAEADDLRKAMGKKKPEIMVKIKEKFLSGCANTNSIPRSVADKIFTDIEYFAGYGFGKGHAASYAELSYTTAYLKANYPAEYMAAVLDATSTSKATDRVKKMTEYLAETRRMGIQVSPPSVTKSGSTFKVESETEILFGLSGVAGIGDAALNLIIADKDRSTWVDLKDMLMRADKSLLNKKTFESLLYAGALDQLLAGIEYQDYEEHEIIDVLIQEKDKLGLFLVDNPVMRLSEYLKKVSTSSVDEASRSNQRTRVKIAGIINRFEERKTRAGKKMWTFELEDYTGGMNGFCYDAIISDLPSKLENNKFYILEAAATFDRANPEERNLVLYDFQPIDLEKVDIEPSLIVDIGKYNPETLKKITKLLNKSKGKSVLKMRYNVDDKIYELRYKDKVSKDIGKTIEDIIDFSNIEVWN